MASAINPWSSSKEWHQNLVDDYNDLVIVPKSILIDTADAIRIKRDGTSAIEAGSVITTGNGIMPEDFATEIGNLVMGSSLTDIQNIAITGTYTSTTRRLEWKGDIRKIAFIAYICNHSNYNNSTFHRGYIFIPSMLSQEFTYGQNTYIPLIKIMFSGANSGYAQIQTSEGNNFNAAVLKTKLTNSYGAADTTSYTATILENNAQTANTGYNGNGLWIRSGISV